MHALPPHTHAMPPHTHILPPTPCLHLLIPALSPTHAFASLRTHALLLVRKLFSQHALPFTCLLLARLASYARLSLLLHVFIFFTHARPSPPMHSPRTPFSSHACPSPRTHASSISRMPSLTIAPLPHPRCYPARSRIPISLYINIVPHTCTLCAASALPTTIISARHNLISSHAFLLARLTT
jgi:hypothetical protein